MKVQGMFIVLVLRSTGVQRVPFSDLTKKRKIKNDIEYFRNLAWRQHALTSIKFHGYKPFLDTN